MTYISKKIIFKPGFNSQIKHLELTIKKPSNFPFADALTLYNPFS